MKTNTTIAAQVALILAMKPGIPYYVTLCNALAVCEKDATDKLHTARRCIADWRDLLTSRQRKNKRHSARPCFPTEHRASMIDLLAGLYDLVAGVLAARGAL